MNNRILIIDDNPSIHGDYKKILSPDTSSNPALDDIMAAVFGTAADANKENQFDLDFAFQGQEGLAKVDTALTAGVPYALAFVDLRMPPGWDGVETITHLWASDPDIQVVICTAYSDYSWREIIGKIGNSDSLLILKKPFDNIEVLQIAHAMTRKWVVTRQAAQKVEDLDRLVRERTAALETLNAQLRQSQKMEAVGHLAAGVAHDFNNLLTVIQGHLSHRLETDQTDPKILESLAAVRQAADQAAELTRHLLIFSRKQVMERHPLRLSTVLGHLSSMLQRLVPETIALEFTHPADLPLIYADRTSLEQVALNLILNARDALPEGGRITVTTDAVEINAAHCAKNAEAREGKFICLSVSDTGTGMDDSTLCHIFEPFYTTKETGKGTGLGLATVHGIIQQHEGWIEVLTAPGRGTTFQIYLPVTNLAEEIPATLAAAATPPPVQSHTILLAEDDANVRALVTSVLEDDGHRVLAAADGHEALVLWSQHRADIDLLFTDMVMPGGIDGAALAARILADSPQLPVIYSSGYSPSLFSEKLQIREGINYLPKPYLAIKLSNIVAQALAK